jgi:Pyruvate/2-oxoacid:ferredoxin oxidoreductase delta subunit
VPIAGDTFDLECTSLIAAISQAPDFDGFEDLREGKEWIKRDDHGKTLQHDVFSGGDNTNLGLVVDAIAHGRMAAAAIHEMISGEPMPHPPRMALITPDKMKLTHYEESQRVAAAELPTTERLAQPDAEIVSTISRDDAVHEAKRCMSCGYCFDCGNCWSYCQDNAVLKPVIKGQPYKFKMEFCNGCKKCAENCPCGYIEMH